jgi:hypothetical protein
MYYFSVCSKRKISHGIIHWNFLSVIVSLLLITLWLSFFLLSCFCARFTKYYLRNLMSQQRTKNWFGLIAKILRISHQLMWSSWQQFIFNWIFFFNKGCAEWGLRHWKYYIYYLYYTFWFTLNFIILFSMFEFFSLAVFYSILQLLLFFFSFL